MAAREERQRGRETNPSRFPETTPPVQQADYAVHTVQTVLEMQRTLGGIEKAIKNLEDRSKEYGDKLEGLGKDVNAAKVVVSVVGGLILVAAGCLGWVINALLQYLSSHPGR
jgi:hypothetical protein